MQSIKTMNISGTTNQNGGIYIYDIPNGYYPLTAELSPGYSFNLRKNPNNTVYIVVLENNLSSINTKPNIAITGTLYLIKV